MSAIPADEQPGNLHCPFQRSPPQMRQNVLLEMEAGLLGRPVEEQQQPTPGLAILLQIDPALSSRARSEDDRISPHLGPRCLEQLAMAQTNRQRRVNALCRALKRHCD